MQYVIIGNGGAGISALLAIRDVDKKSDIFIMSREKYPAYSPCSLPNLISGELEKPKIFRFDEKFYNQQNVKFMKNTEALQISPKDKEVRFSKNKIIRYDKLLIATGANPITPKGILGLDLDGVHIMGTLDSTLEIIYHIDQGVKHVVIVGGGFIGVETATMLKKRGIKVSIVETLSNILSRMLDSDMSEKVSDILINNGINLILNNSVKSINGNKKVNSVTLHNGTLDCDMVVVSIGVLPNTNVIKNSGIKVNNGIIVDTTMQTNIKNIYAAGDITEVKDQIEGKKGSFAIWPNAIEQGRIAGLNMAGKNTNYSGADIVNVLDVFNTPVVALGYTYKDIDKCESISRFTPNTSKKIHIKNKRIVGLQFIGSIRNVGTFYGLMKKGTDISDIKERLLDDNFVISPTNTH